MRRPVLLEARVPVPPPCGRRALRPAAIVIPVRRWYAAMKHGPIEVLVKRRSLQVLVVWQERLMSYR